MYYWIITIITVILLCLSFYGYMKSIGVGMVIFSIRNVIPLFDFENRKEIIKEVDWDLLVILVGCTTIINL